MEPVDADSGDDTLDHYGPAAARREMPGALISMMVGSEGHAAMTAETCEAAISAISRLALA